ncbi:MAG: polysaccharide export protein, partial [Fervidobacterium pennivorans]
MHIYLQGAVNQTLDISNFPEVTLTRVFSILSLSPASQTDLENVQIRRGGKTQVFNMLQYFYDGTISEDPKLQEGDIIYIPPLKFTQMLQVSGAYTYVTRYEPGMTLKTLLLNLGALDKDKAVIESSYLTLSGKTTIVNLEDVISGKIDYPLTKDAALYIPKREERFVYVVGFIPWAGLKTFSINEPQTLAFALAKAGGISPENEKWVEKILITHPNGSVQEYKPDILKIAERIILPNGSIVDVVRYTDFKVYLTGDFASGIINFEPNESKTLKTLLTKIGGLKTDQLKWIESIKINDKSVDLSKLDTYTLNNGDSVEIKKYPEFYVYVQGYAKQTGKITLEPDESKTLKTLVNKIGLASPDVENEGKAIINNKISVELKDVVYSNKDVPLSLGDTVLFAYEPFVVYISGSGLPGVLQLSYYEPKTVSYVFKKLVSVPENITEVVLIRNGKEEAFEPTKLLYGQADKVIEKSDTIVFKQADVNAVYLVGDVSSYVSFALNEPITIHRILAKVGISDLRRIKSIKLGEKQIDFTT